jgi:NADH-quinone oxidoreductase subunit H
MNNITINFLYGMKNNFIIVNNTSLGITPDLNDYDSPISENELFTNFDKFIDLFGIIKYEIHAYSMFFLLIIATLVGVIINIAFYTLAERKVMAAIQRRRGPNMVGFLGLIQPIADGLKLVVKEIIIPSRANRMIFFGAPFLTLTLTFVNWSLISFSTSDLLINLNLSLLILFTISSFNIYSIIIAGWSSNSRYPFLGALRAASQMISYEVSLTVIFICIVLSAGSFNLLKISHVQQEYVGWFCWPLFPLFIIFIISILAETNRAPFDLPEAEAEIVAGYNVEYSSITFAIFFLGEYGNMLLMSALTVMIFCGGWTTIRVFGYLDYLLLSELFFSFKIVSIAFLFILVRATFPRLRYDQLMLLGWTIFLPITTVCFIILLCLKLSLGSFDSQVFNTLIYYNFI